MAYSTPAKPITPARPVGLRPGARGFALLESLVALLVLSLALMGLAGTQVRMALETRHSVQRGVAVRLIEGVSEKIKANAAGLALYSVALGAGVPGAPDCTAAQAVCTSTQLAQSDVRYWKAEVARMLPAGDAAIFPSSDPLQLGVMVAWRTTEPSSNAAYVASVGTLAVAAAPGQTALNCPAGYTCHVAYVQP